MPENTIESDEIENKMKDEKDDYMYGNNYYDNKELREKIEAKLKPLDIEEFLFNGRMTQKVPLGEKSSVIFQTQKGTVSILCSRVALDKADKKGIPPQQIFSYYQMAAAINTLIFNDKELIVPDDNLTPKSDVELVEEKAKKDPYLRNLEAKVNILESLPQNFLALISTQLSWFEDRVNKFFKNDLERALVNF